MAKSDKKTDKHDIDTTRVDSLDEISGDEQLALVWCNTHKAWEWHWVDRTILGTEDGQ